MYPLLRYGDRLPTVAATQILLNRKMRRGSYIAVDGVFGPKTREAVRTFQRDHSLTADGTVGKDTWGALTQGEDLSVVDSVDLTDPKDIGLEDAAIQAAGGSPIVNFGMCGGLIVALQKIQNQAAGQGKVVLLRFHGHGSPGSMGVASGKGAEPSSEFVGMFSDSLARFVAHLRWVFSSFGSVELHGCRVGAGRDGRRLVSALAWAWGVPVTAGLRMQYGGGSSTFRFEGPTITGFPRGGDLTAWARSLPAPEVHGVSVDR